MPIEVRSLNFLACNFHQGAWPLAEFCSTTHNRTGIDPDESPAGNYSFRMRPDLPQRFSLNHHQIIRCPYEKLVGDLNGAYSRRINIQHRLVYQVLEEEKAIKILRLWSHYA
jgi:Txe/YoeB family toxin of Txe-Axe toxin-antitoxin module